MSITRKVSQKKNFTVPAGATFTASVELLQRDFEVKPITGVSQSSRAVVTCAGHGIPQRGSLVYIRGVRGLVEVNHKAESLEELATGRDCTAYRGVAIDADTVRIECDTLDAPKPYSGGGEILYYPPVDLTGARARMDLRRRASDTSVALSVTSDTTTPGGSCLAVGGVGGWVDITIGAGDSTALKSGTYFFDVELFWDAVGTPPHTVVTRMVEGMITVSPETTRTGG